ncbi:NUDIX domain-containing protein [Amorphus coralli]|uniref:NUDIX domain-containing protein n=1 Tax=Amorphus coralli TaxID=340680 RepID=UPI0003747789|nr:NUDIX domain-containing protein [Amorphus coralli]
MIDSIDTPNLRQRLHSFAGKRLLRVRHRVRLGVSLGVKGMVLTPGNEVFLVRHSYLPGFHLPGGGVDPGETVHEAMARELREEGNLELGSPASLFGVYFNEALDRRDHVVLFVARDATQPAPPQVPNGEILECGFFAIDDLPKTTTAATRRRLDEVLGGAVRSDIW